MNEEPSRDKNPLGVPFSRDELVRAHMLVGWSREDVEEMVAALFEPDEETTGFVFTDGTLLLLASLSDDLGDRVVQYRPELEEEVARIRRDPDAFMEGLSGE